MPKRRKKAMKLKPVLPDEVIVVWEEDPNDERGGYPVIYSDMQEIPDGAQVGIYSLEQLGTAKRTTALVS